MELWYSLVIVPELYAENNWHDAWERCFCTGVYARIPESHRVWIRSINPNFKG